MPPNGKTKAGTAHAEEPPAPKRFRSATDYENEASLRDALTESPYVRQRPNEIEIGPCEMDGDVCTVDGNLCTEDRKLTPLCCDWQTAKLDLSSSHPQCMEDEVKRLMELKTYHILDAEHEEKFERITALASRIFDVPICLVSLVDVGRQWFMSNRGLGEVRETSREVSFCAHAIRSKEEVFIIPDTYPDPRFKDNGLVTGGPLIRFYAGVPLVTPGGYKLGTFCIIDRKPRPMGLNLTEKQNLRELTEMVMDTMVHRKQEMEHLLDEKTRVIACAAHDLLSPLTGIQLNLGLLMEDATLREKLDDNQKELMEASVKCSDMIERICVSAIASFRGDLTRAHRPNLIGDSDTREKGVVDVDQLVSNIERVVGAYPKKVPFFIEKDPAVPQSIISDDLKLFRSILNYLTNACKKTETGMIRLRVYVRKAAQSASKMELELLPGALVAPKRDSFIMEVHDTGPGIDLERYPDLFTPPVNHNADVGTNENHHSKSGIGLYSVHTEISSLAGEYGVFPRQDLVATHPVIDMSMTDEPSVTGCVFWLSVPLVLPATSLAPSTSILDIPMANLEMDKANINGCTKSNVPDGSKQVPALPVLSPSLAKNAPFRTSGDVATKSLSDVVIQQETSKRTKRALILDISDSPTTRKGGISDMDQAEYGLQKKFKANLKSNVTDDSKIKTEMSDSSDTSGTIDGWDEGSLKSPSDVAIQQETSNRVKRVLIIDDSLTIRKGLARVFSRQGFEVNQAENGLQGFKKLKANNLYDIVLLDFLMPFCNGLDMARNYREWEKEHRPNFHQYIVGISAHANGNDAEVGLKAGMDHFMGKPISLKSLKDLAQSKTVTEASILLDTRHASARYAMETACKLAKARSDEGEPNSLRSLVSSSTSTFAKQSCLVVSKEREPDALLLQRIIEKNGWRAVVVNGDGEDALPHQLE